MTLPPHLHVLLIEDSLSDQFLITELLTSTFKSLDMTLSVAGVVATLSAARTTLQRLAETDVSLPVVIVDLNLPDSQGMETYDRLEDLLAPFSHLVLSDHYAAVTTLRGRGVTALQKGADLPDLPGHVLEAASRLLGTASPVDDPAAAEPRTD